MWFVVKFREGRSPTTNDYPHVVLVQDTSHCCTHTAMAATNASTTAGRVGHGATPASGSRYTPGDVVATLARGRQGYNVMSSLGGRRSIRHSTR